MQTFVESYTKAVQKHVNYNSSNKFCDKIVYFGGPSRKDLSFGADPDRSATAGRATSATLHLNIVSGNRFLSDPGKPGVRDSDRCV